MYHILLQRNYMSWKQRETWSLGMSECMILAKEHEWTPRLWNQFLNWFKIVPQKHPVKHTGDVGIHSCTIVFDATEDCVGQDEFRIALRKRDWLTFIYSTVLKNQLVNELEALWLSSCLQTWQQRIVCEVKLRWAWDSLHIFAILYSTVAIVAIISTKPFLSMKKQKLSSWMTNMQ